MKAKIKRNKRIIKWYFEGDLSTYAIAKKVRAIFHENIEPPNVWRVIKRDAAKYGYGENHEA